MIIWINLEIIWNNLEFIEECFPYKFWLCCGVNLRTGVNSIGPIAQLWFKIFLTFVFVIFLLPETRVYKMKFCSELSHFTESTSGLVKAGLHPGAN